MTRHENVTPCNHKKKESKQHLLQVLALHSQSQQTGPVSRSPRRQSRWWISWRHKIGQLLLRGQGGLQLCMPSFSSRRCTSSCFCRSHWGWGASSCFCRSHWAWGGFTTLRLLKNMSHSTICLLDWSFLNWVTLGKHTTINIQTRTCVHQFQACQTMLKLMDTSYPTAHAHQRFPKSNHCQFCKFIIGKNQWNKFQFFSQLWTAKHPEVTPQHRKFRHTAMPKSMQFPAAPQNNPCFTMDVRDVNLKNLN